jgi:hypothetical protein
MKRNNLEIDPCNSESVSACEDCRQQKKIGTCEAVCNGRLCQRDVINGKFTCREHVGTNVRLFGSNLQYTSSRELPVNKSSSETYNASSKMRECEKNFANNWFVQEVYKTDHLKHNVFILDAETLVTSRLLQTIMDKRLGYVQIPNPHAYNEIKSNILKGAKWMKKKLFLHEMTSNELLRSYDKTRSNELTGVWLDYTGSFTGDAHKHKNWQKSVDDIHLLLQKRLLKNDSVLAVTYTTMRGAEFNNTDHIDATIRCIGDRYKYRLKNICKGNPSFAHKCNDKPISCDKSNLVFTYGRGMNMIMYHVSHNNEGSDIVQYIDKRIDEGNNEEYLLRFRNELESHWVLTEHIETDSYFNLEGEYVEKERENGDRLIKWKGYDTPFNTWVDKDGTEIDPPDVIDDGESSDDDHDVIDDGESSDDDHDVIDDGESSDDDHDVIDDVMSKDKSHHSGLEILPTKWLNRELNQIYIKLSKNGKIHTKVVVRGNKKRAHTACIYADCKTIALFGNNKDSRAFYCGKHKKSGMINIIAKRCAYSGCDSQPSFGFGRVMYCVTHKLDGMYNVYKADTPSPGGRIVI